VRVIVRLASGERPDETEGDDNTADETNGDADTPVEDEAEVVPEEARRPEIDAVAESLPLSVAAGITDINAQAKTHTNSSSFVPIGARSVGRVGRD
jgi:hypothetical protein